MGVGGPALASSLVPPYELDALGPRFDYHERSDHVHALEGPIAMRKLILWLAIAGILCVSSLARAEDPALAGKPATEKQEQELRDLYANYRQADPGYRHAGPEAVERWMDWKWGLRIHWGLYCMFNGGESWILVNPPKSRDWQLNYYASYQQFNPAGFDADEWMRIMQRAGMKYFSFTSKHHEGFCMWPTKTLQKGFRKKADGSYEEVTDHYSIAETPFKRDILGEIVKAGRAHGLGVSLYYSHIDWHDCGFRLGQPEPLVRREVHQGIGSPAMGGVHPEGAGPDHRTSNLLRPDRHALPGHQLAQGSAAGLLRRGPARPQVATENHASQPRHR